MTRPRDVAKKIFDIYQWNSLLASNIITACDLAIIPLPLDDPFIAGKPENELLLFWRMGMPTVVSVTPAYERVIEQSGLQMVCKTQHEWEEKLETLIISKQAREDAGKHGLSFVNDNYNDQKILEQWDNVFESVFNYSPLRIQDVQVWVRAEYHSAPTVTQLLAQSAVIQLK